MGCSGFDKLSLNANTDDYPNPADPVPADI